MQHTTCWSSMQGCGSVATTRFVGNSMAPRRNHVVVTTMWARPTHPTSNVCIPQEGFTHPVQDPQSSLLGSAVKALTNAQWQNCVMHTHDSRTYMCANSNSVQRTQLAGCQQLSNLLGVREHRHSILWCTAPRRNRTLATQNAKTTN